MKEEAKKKIRFELISLIVIAIFAMVIICLALFLFTLGIGEALDDLNQYLADYSLNISNRAAEGLIVYIYIVQIIALLYFIYSIYYACVGLREIKGKEEFSDFHKKSLPLKIVGIYYVLSNTLSLIILGADGTTIAIIIVVLLQMFLVFTTASALDAEMGNKRKDIGE